MKTRKSLRFIVPFFLLQSMASLSFAQTWYPTTWIPITGTMKIWYDNELTPDRDSQTSDISDHPLRLDGKMMSDSNFNLESKGKLSLVRGNAEDSVSEKIQFSLLIRRNGKIVHRIYSTAGTFEIEISKVLRYATMGDQLIISPIHSRDWRAKRILKLLPGC